MLIWMASSRTGANIKPMGEGVALVAEVVSGAAEDDDEDDDEVEVDVDSKDVLLVSTRACINGNRKAHVLPLPVFATDTMSRPDNIIGQACACTGVGVSYESVSTCVIIGPKGAAVKDS